MHEPEIALVFSSEPWFEDLHRHLTDHGGARVRQVVMDPAIALDEQFDTLLVSHRWPALTRRFVDGIHEHDRWVLGVYEPSEPASREFLVSLGVDGVVAGDAAMAVFVETIVGFGRSRSRVERDDTQQGRMDGASDDEVAFAASERGAELLVVGGPPGAGRTEVALAVALALARFPERTLLFDADESWPAVAQRLALPVEPNLRMAIEAVEHGVGDPERCVHPLAPGLDVLCGLPNVALWAQIRPAEVLDVVRAMGRERGYVVADVGSSTEEFDGGGHGRFAITRAIVGEAVRLFGVGGATPVGISRLLRWVAAARMLNTDAPVHLIVNRSTRSAYREGEIEREIRRTFAPATLTFLPDDRRIEAACWSGEAVVNGPLVRAIHRLLGDALARPPRRRRPRRRGQRVTVAAPVAP